MRQSGETMTSVSASHIILTPTQPFRSGWPQQDQTHDLYTRSRALYRLSFGAPHTLGFLSSGSGVGGTLLCGNFGNGGTLTFMVFFCGRGKIGGDNNELLRNECIESCLTEQSCSIDLPCVTFCFILLPVRPLGC